ncbi:MAG: 23S rRNA (guanosine(2251)-2'-O)-methyltransferase RlmB [Taibaiella sp.]|nr:23S rRNA (guanosine(2251)-2'-O)-methyltransferase RlmB [Taibaiella sp.]
MKKPHSRPKAAFHTPRSAERKPGIARNRLIIGRKPIIEALEGGTDIDKIFILKSATGDDIQTIKQKARERNIAWSMVPVEKLDRMSKSNHQGIIGVAGLITYYPLQPVIDQVTDKGGIPLFMVLDGITDTRNLGAIARSAYCFGADAIVLPVSNAAAVTEDAIKTSAGALAHIPVCREASIEQIMDILRLNGIRTMAMDINGTEVGGMLTADQPVAVIMGAEDSGVSKFVLKNADQLVRIPQSNKFDSLKRICSSRNCIV